MTVIIITTGILAGTATALAATTLMAVIALTDINDRMRQWVMHRIWW